VLKLSGMCVSCTEIIVNFYRIVLSTDVYFCMIANRITGFIYMNCRPHVKIDLV